jgi:hypothetical protein
MNVRMHIMNSVLVALQTVRHKVFVLVEWVMLKIHICDLSLSLYGTVSEFMLRHPNFDTGET